MAIAANIIVIPLKPELVGGTAIKRLLRVAAYCRVSTDDEEQLTSYETQKTFYTDKIMSNPDWTMAGIFADEGITGTQAKKRPEFLRMIRQCKQGKIDVVLTKSVSRFARNTMDCLKYVRALRENGVAVIFEKEGINTLEMESEIFLTMYGAFSQSESESISKSVGWGKQQAMREGRTSIQYKRLYAYRRGADNKPEIIPEEAEIVHKIYDQYLAGASIRMIRESLEAEQVPNAVGELTWTASAVKGILTNEKYYGDVLMQKTFSEDYITKRVIRNTGQRPMYLVQNHHEGIVDRAKFDAVQAEMARRNAGRSPSKKNAPTGRSCYASKYALSERLVCGECGTLYRRCVWVKRGRRRVVWRCVSRLVWHEILPQLPHAGRETPPEGHFDGDQQGHERGKEELVQQVAGAVEQALTPVPGQAISLADISRRLGELEGQFNKLLEQAAEEPGDQNYLERFQRITNEIAALKEQRSQIEEQRRTDAAAAQRMDTAVSLLAEASPELTEWNEPVIRQLVDTVRVLSADRIAVYLRGGIEIQQEITD